ncbi:hypothetical protein BA899_01880 [Spiribacter sp. SSL99]|uniref:IS3 family transposase n=1 Tax=Spiribacter sp. SSL99 TaxID=1866884 RepID=UPI0013304CB5|nr:IS3 family transposase [Spiribacter sp. SSL99]KAF0285577.1 hypothetical protein BA899_01880 [Spiribacter sp. SSL99]
MLGVSRSGYYAWLGRRETTSQRLTERAKRDAKVVELFEAKKRRYGSPRLCEELEAEGMAMNRKTVAESMRRQGPRARAAKPFRHTTDSGHSLGVAPNLLAQDFSAIRPDEKWAGDITYLRTIQGWLYLAVILDLCTPIGHLKADHRMRRNFLKGALGDVMNPILAAAGFNIRWLMRWLVVFLRRILSAVLRLLDQGGTDARSNLKPAAA